MCDTYCCPQSKLKSVQRLEITLVKRTIWDLYTEALEIHFGWAYNVTFGKEKEYKCNDNKDEQSR